MNGVMKTIYVSTNISKLGITIPTISLPAGTTCRADAPCKRLCYACKGNFRYPSVRKSLENNLRIYHETPDLYFGYLDFLLTSVPYKYFRYHSSGDIVDTEYLRRMCLLARKHQSTSFLCFTKKYELVNKYISSKHKIPNNLRIVFSNWGDFLCDNPYGLPEAYVKLTKEDGYIPADAKKCSGFCGSCVNTDGSCWNLKSGESVCFDQH